VFYLQLLLFSGLAFFLMLGWLKRTLTITLDVDWFYRRLGPAAARRLDAMADAGWDGLVSGVARSVRAIAAGVQRLHGPGGILARPWPTGSMAFWATVMLALYSILSYL
jgi:multicomponent Na+:H+ antiporter subunit D